MSSNSLGVDSQSQGDVTMFPCRSRMYDATVSLDDLFGPDSCGGERVQMALELYKAISTMLSSRCPYLSPFVCLTFIEQQLL